MVSFSCEVCNEVFTKKKVDNHRNNSCRGATFVCLDCMRHFVGTEYRSHTSCVSEAQKYQGALYNDRKSKSSKALTSSVRRSASIPRRAYVEDAPDDLEDGGGTIVIVEAPPPAPSPPPPPQQSQPPQQAIPAVNVFDFLVDEDTPNGSRTTINLPDEEREPMRVGHDVPPPPPVIVEASPRPLGHIGDHNGSRETFGESRYAENGYHYGGGPVPAVHRHERYMYVTPAAHRHRLAAPPRDDDRDREDGPYRNGDSGQQHSKHRKRKRIQVEELQIERIRSHSAEGDQIMTDAPPMLHTGLTGGLKGLLTRTASDYPPSPDYSGDGGAADRGEPSPSSPLKRSKRHSVVGNPTLALVSTRRRSTSDGHHHVPRLHRRHSSSHHPRRHHRRHSRHQDDDTGERPTRKLKTIKYRGEEDGESQNESQQNPQQLVLYRGRVELFMSFITKGPGSEKGCSMNKALKRYHRDRVVIGGMSKAEEEKELWKSLRLKKNERGEIVLFAASASDEGGMMSS